MSSTSECKVPAARIAAVTGGSGFIGSHLVDALLDKGYQVRCLVRRSSPQAWLRGAAQGVYGDLNNETDCRRLIDGADVIFHLGGAGVRRIVDEPNVNDDGTRNLARVWKEQASGAHFLYLSTIKVSRLEKLQSGESDRNQALYDPYGYSKRRGEQWIRQAADGGAGPASIVRAPLVYGPRDLNLLGVFRFAQRKWLPEITGRDMPKFSHVYVSDLVDYLIELADAPAAATVTTGVEYFKQTDWNEMARGIHHWAHGCTASRSIRRDSLESLRKLAQRLSGPFPGACRVPLIRLNDLLDGDLAFSGDAAEFTRTTGVAAGVRITGDWYRCAGWL